MTRAIYPGSFDPLTKGHLDIINRASKLVDTLIIGVPVNSSKSPAFSVEERIEMIKASTKQLSNVEIKGISGLLVEFASKENINVIIKGLRDLSDFEYEFQMALMNKKLNANVETMFMLTAPEYSFCSSSIVKEVAKYYGDISYLVPEEILDNVRKRLEPQ